MAERKAFKFYRSYFEVYNELSDKDKLLFIEAILRKQFYGEEPSLKGMAAFAYKSQKHSIDLQVRGYEDKTGNKLTPMQGALIDPYIAPCVQEKEKEKEKEKEEYKAESFDFPLLLQFINQHTGRNYTVINQTVRGKYNARLKDGYTKKQIELAIVNASQSEYHKGEKCKYLTPEFFSRSSTIDKYGIETEPKVSQSKNYHADFSR
jgi:uncharacterized phage protein (TIGR02220 family)